MTSPREKPERIDATCGDSMCDYKGSYVMEARCANCGWTGELKLTVGHDFPLASAGPGCPRCGCRRLSSGDFVEAIEAHS